jgi:hypothetical protein
MRKLPVVLAVLVLLGLGLRAEARPVHFYGPHPIAQKFGGGYCYLDGPHIHIYAPDHMQLYNDVGGELVFAGDPTPFGYEGPHFTFYGPHPVPGVPGIVYCYIDGPHYHPYAPPEGPDYRMQGDVAFYIGAYDPVYYRERPHREKQVSVIYRPYVAQRPVVTVAPPVEWHGSVWVAPPAVEVRAGVVMPPPPVAGVSVEVQAPGIYVAPPAAGVHVQVGAPPPVYVAPRPVYVQPQPVYVGAPRPVYIEREHEHEHEWRHDNGRHEGWYKHEDHHHEDNNYQGQGWGKHRH